MTWSSGQGKADDFILNIILVISLYVGASWWKHIESVSSFCIHEGVLYSLDRFFSDSFFEIILTVLFVKVWFNSIFTRLKYFFEAFPKVRFVSWLMVKSFALFYDNGYVRSRLIYLISCKGEGFNDLRCFNVFFNSFFELFMYFWSNSLCTVSTVSYELAKIFLIES